MHAVVIRDTQLHWEERDDPVPGDTELLVAVRAAGLNAADLVQRAGFYPAPPGWPADIPGMEFAGEVVAVGRQVTLFSPGDRVMAVVGGGAQATLALVDETHALAVPDGLPWTEAGGFPEVFTTAYDALFRQAELQMGERVLVSGAAGGVGTAGVQLAARAGATVTATVRDPARHDAVAALGRRRGARARRRGGAGPLRRRARAGRRAEPDQRPAAPGDVGPRRGDRCRRRGRMELELMDLMRKRVSIGGSTLRARSRREKADVAADMAAHVLPALVAGRLQIPVYETFPLAEAAAGLRPLRRRRQVRQGGPRRAVIEAVLFDGDQTLWDFERVIRDALVAVAAELRAARPGPFADALRWEDLQADRAEVARERPDVWSLAELPRPRLHPHAAAPACGRGR